MARPLLLPIVWTGVVGSLLAGQTVPYGVIDVKNGGTLSGTVSGASRPVVPLVVTRSVATCGPETPNPSLEIGAAGALKNAVVSIDPVPAGKAFPPGGGSTPLEMRGCVFVPHVAVLPFATPLVMVNRDRLLHHVEVYSGSEAILTTVLPVSGYRAERRIDKTGRFTVRSAAGFSWMSAILVVSPHPYVAVTDARGSYVMKSVPPGSYTVTVWHETLGEKTASVLVEPRRTAVLDFVLSN